MKLIPHQLARQARPPRVSLAGGNLEGRAALPPRRQLPAPLGRSRAPRGPRRLALPRRLRAPTRCAGLPGHDGRDTGAARARPSRQWSPSNAEASERSAEPPPPRPRRTPRGPMISSGSTVPSPPRRGRRARRRCSSPRAACELQSFIGHSTIAAHAPSPRRSRSRSASMGPVILYVAWSPFEHRASVWLPDTTASTPGHLRFVHPRHNKGRTSVC